jgi:Na+-translocating ferredoxin:NAD+ oxidoreductase subunit D
METAIVQENSPHLRRKDNLTGMMVDVLIALSPVVIFAIVKYTWHAVVVDLLSVFTMCLAEFVFVLIKNWGPKDGQKHPFKEKFATAIKGYGINNFLVPCVSAVIFAMLMPAQETTTPGFIYFVVVIGALFGMIIGKLVFGGTGQNIFNPAAVGFIFTKVCFQSKFTTYYASSMDVQTGGTILSGSATSSFDMSPLNLLLGQTGGTFGEVCKIAILCGLVYLLIRHVADWRVVSAFFGTFIVLTAIASWVYVVRDPSVDFLHYFLVHLLSGGVLFGGTYMLTDPVTMPITRPSRVIYGMFAAVCVVFIRLFGTYNEGMGFSILIANMAAPVMDHYKWSTNKYTWKNLLAMGIIAVLAIGILVWGLNGKFDAGTAKLAY